MTKKRNKKEWYDSSSYTSPVASRQEGNWGYERDSRYTKYKDVPVPSSKKKKKIRAKMVK